MENLDFILSLFNQYLFQDAKNNLESLKYYINTNPSTRGNRLISELVGAIDTYTLDSIDKPLFESILTRCGKTAAERDEILQKVITWKGYDKNQMAPAIKYLKDVCAASVIQKANNLFSGDPTGFIKYIKDTNFTLSDADFFASKTFKEIDINSIIADTNIAAAKTNYPWINSLWPAFEGIPFGQLITVSAACGVGKSLFSQGLATYFASIGYKTLYVTLGDLNWLDFITRMGSTVFKVPFEYAYKNPAEMYNRLSDVLGDNLEISINPAGTVTANDIIEKVLRENFDIVFVDYDGNLSMEGSDDDSMYKSYGDVYARFTRLSMAGKLCFLLSQPKVCSYQKLINMADIGESSKKQQMVDAIFTISDVNPDCPNNVYVLSCCKNRRGRQGKTYVIRVEGNFIEIPKSVYDQLRQVTEERIYTFNDIDVMIHQANMNAYTQRNMMNQVNSNYQSPSQTVQPQQKFNGVNPFEGIGN